MPSQRSNRQQKQPANHDKNNQPQGTWKLTERPHGRSSAIKPIGIVHSNDSNAEIAWRTHAPPSCTIKIPPDLIVAGEQQEYLELARRSSAYIHSCSGGSGNVFGIWADTGEQANAARQVINDWISRETVPGNRLGVSQFTKVRSMTDRHRQKTQERWEREVRRHRFRQVPPPGATFEAIGTFAWPVNEVKPEDALGQSLEAFDSIRMSRCCYIVLGDENSVIQVLGNIKDVQAALVAIRGTFSQLIARQLKPARIYLVHWDTSYACPQSILLEDYIHPAFLSSTETERSKGVTYRAIDWDHESKYVSHAISMIRASISKTIKSLHYYSADIRFRVRLGTFIATSYMRPDTGIHTFGDFESMIIQSQFAGEITRELGHIPTEKNVLDILQSASGTLEPLELMTTNLIDVLPAHSAVFVFELPDGDYQLTMLWQEFVDYSTGDKRLAATPSKWAKLDSDTGLPTRLLDVNLLRLDSNLAWHFEMQATQIISEGRLPDKLKPFASRVKIAESVISQKDTTTPIVTYVEGDCGLKSLTCNITYSYRLAQSEYVLELARFQRWDFSMLKVLIGKPPPKIQEPRWGLSIYNTAWDKMLSENGNLDVGARANWSDAIEAWLPEGLESTNESTGQGLLYLIDKMEQVEVVLKQSIEA